MVRIASVSRNLLRDEYHFAAGAVADWLAVPVGCDS